jgi:hypothetical protein
MAAPVGSVTAPLIVAVLVCASNMEAEKRARRATAWAPEDKNRENDIALTSKLGDLPVTLANTVGEIRGKYF